MSRPTISDEASTKIVQVRITPAQRRDLNRAAQMNMQTISQFVRDAIVIAAGDCLEAPICHTKQRP